MELVHFTPGTIAFDKVGELASSAAVLPLASGKGDVQVSCLYLRPGGSIAVPPTSHCQLIMTVNGIAKARLPNGFGPRIFAGMGMLLTPDETCQLESKEDAVIISVEATELEADLCGISAPERVAGQHWPALVSN